LDAKAATMLTHFSCPECRSKLSVSAALAGRRTRCPTCSHLLTVPEASRRKQEIPVEIEPSADDGGAEVVQPLPESPVSYGASSDLIVPNEATEKPTRPSRMRTTLFVIGLLVLLVGLLAGAVAGGIWAANLAEGTLGRRQSF
jgi:hypothetical protein